MQSNKAPLTTIIAGTLAFAGSYALYESVTQYGWEGTVNYIWLGNPFPDAPILEYCNLVAETETSLEREISRIVEIENALGRTELEHPEDFSGSKRSLVLSWIRNYPRLEKVLSDISNKLDSIAAQVDGILLSNVDSSARKVQELKLKRKELSKKVVVCMERCDALLTLFNMLLDET